MPTDTQTILDAADKLGQLIAQHPAVEKFKAAQKSVESDPEASRLMADFGKHMENLERQVQAGMNVTDAQRQQMETMQSRIVSHIKIKNLNLAQVDFIDLLRKVSQTYQKHLGEAAAAKQG